MGKSMANALGSCNFTSFSRGKGLRAPFFVRRGINRAKPNGGRAERGVWGGQCHKKRDTLRVRAAKGLSQQQEEEEDEAEGNMQIRHRSPQDTGNMRQELQQLSHYGHATLSQ